MYRTAYDRMYELLWYLLEYETEPITLTQWGRAVGLRRTPYLAQLADRLVKWGAVEIVPAFTTVRGLTTKGYVLADRPAEFFNDVIETLLGAAEAQLGIADND